MLALVIAIATSTTFDLDVRGPAWQVESLTATLAADLAGPEMQLAKNADLHVAIVVEPRALQYALTREGVAPVRGTIALPIDRQSLGGVIKDALRRLVPHPAAPTSTSAALVFLLGGLAWGLALGVCVPIAFPPLGGLHRVDHSELGRALRAWLALAARRSATLALLLAALGAVLWLGDPVLTLGVIAPSIILAARFAWLAAARILARRLDRTLVDGNDWHDHVRAYYVGYLRRANLDVDEEALARVRFLPGKTDRVAVYGGSYTRVVIPRAMLEAALAPYGRPHDIAKPRLSTLHWTYWSNGLVMPTTADDKLATRSDRDPKTSIHLNDDTAHERLALGEPPTLTGIVEPVAFDPRTSYRPAEDPLWLDWDPGEEFDGTDAGDRDFLFGVIAHAMGVAQRGEDRAETFRLAFPRIPRASSRLADLYAVLHGARHHLAQYIAWQLWHRDDLLTARAYVPQLEHRSRSILTALDTDPAEDQPALRARLQWLRGFIDPRATRKVSQRRRLAIAFALLAALAGVAALVVQAALYHSTYEERHDDGRR